MSHEMDTTTMVTMVEKLLPKTQKREWVTRMNRRENNESNDGSLFRTLLSYLLQEKRVIEYMENDVRGHGASSTRQSFQAVHSAEMNTSHNANFDMNPNDMTPKDFSRLCSHIQNMTERMEDLLNDRTKRTKGYLQKKQLTSDLNDSCWIHKTDSHSINKCNVFLNSSHEEKLRYLRQNGACYNCLKQGHIATSCSFANQCEKINQLQQKCGKRHHPALHLEQSPVSSFTRSSASHMAGNKMQEAILAVSHVFCNDKKLAVLWDSGANVSLITQKAATSLNLDGSEVELSITKLEISHKSSVQNAMPFL